MLASGTGGDNTRAPEPTVTGEAGRALHAVHTVHGLAAWAGGPSRTISALTSYLAGAGVSVSLLTTYAESETLILPSADVRLTTIGRRGGLDALRLPRVRAALAQYIADHPGAVVHDHGMWLPINHAVAAVCARARTVPRVVSPKGMLDTTALAFGRRKKDIAWWLYQRRDLQRAAAFQATSETEAASIRALGFEQPIAVISHGVTCPAVTRPARADPDASRQALFLSRLHPIKGVADLIHAWDNVRPKGWTLKIVGGGEAAHRREVEALVAAVGLRDDIRIHDEVTDDEKWDIYAESDLFVLPSYSENFGVVIAEALGTGLPVITTTATPWQDIRASGCGWWIETGVDSLTATLRAATALAPAELQAMGERGAALIARKYAWHSVASSMADFYRWLLGRGPRPGFVV